MTLLEENPTGEAGDMGESGEQAAALAASVAPVNESAPQVIDVKVVEASPPPVETEGDLYSQLRDMRRADGEYDGIKLVDIQEEKEFQEGVELAFARAKSIPDLKKRAAEYQQIHNPDGGVQEQLTINEHGWFEAIPGNRKSEMIVTELNKRRAELTKEADEKLARSKLYKAFSWVQERNSDQKEAEKAVKDRLIEERQDKERLNAWHDQQRADAIDDVWDYAQTANKMYDISKDYDEFDKEMDALRGERRGLKRKAEQQEEARLQEEKLTEAMGGLDSFDDYKEQQLSNALEPIRAEMRDLREQKIEAIEVAERSRRVDVKDVVALYVHKEAELGEKLMKTKKEVEQRLIKEAQHLQEVRFNEHRAMDRIKATDTGKHIYTPDKDTDPAVAALIAADNADMVGRLAPPFQVDEYGIPADKPRTVMQRIVYLTADKNVIIVEDWDKSSGKLKRQSVVKGRADELTVPDYVNDDLGKIRTRRRKKSGESRTVLSNKVYKDLGPIVESDVAADFGTSYQDGYSSYTQNLVRSGGLSGTTAREIASHNYNPKQSKKFKGFIQSLQDEIAKPKATKSKKK